MSRLGKKINNIETSAIFNGDYSTFHHIPIPNICKSDRHIKLQSRNRKNIGLSGLASSAGNIRVRVDDDNEYYDTLEYITGEDCRTAETFFDEFLGEEEEGGSDEE